MREEIRLLKAARLTKADPIARETFNYHHMGEKEQSFMSYMCGNGVQRAEKMYLVQCICMNWNLPADEVFNPSLGIWPLTTGMPFLLRLLVLSHITKHRSAVAELKKVLELKKREN